MNTQQQAPQTAITAVGLERLDGLALRIFWDPPVEVDKVLIYRSEQPVLDENGDHLVAVVTQAQEWTFQDPNPGARGYYFVKFGELGVVPVAERVLPLLGALNFRDMGGYGADGGRSVKWGKLYRSADLSRLTEADLAYLKQLELAWICDLRTDIELEHSPSPRIGNERNEQLSFMSSANPDEMMKLEDINEDMLALMNRHMVGNAELSADFFRRLLKLNGAPFLFHCAAGKDRTGFLASLILQALGVDREVILTDYALTNQFAERFKAGMLSVKRGDNPHASFMSKLTPEVAQALSEARPAYLAASFEEIDARYGSFENYWTNGLGLSAGELERLRSLYLE
ncbi:tyrosine-protein phosphatase [Paenibacillus sp. LHD-117]|uniref:tyrosine-protein phosphatase n=1 Tax=Paenibacillus sp. LHD-117 TaxID=3071412 RepID=UPI0027DF90ED|nr:tyrosine-protein phosphatase [Paenibacillus sp. LHD-117]MDQ6420242.1 tyrosine-protein phosphatase [Paenibacillus sp. LHD-117]